MAKCKQTYPHKKSYGDGSWEVSGWVPGTHPCLCLGDAVVAVNISIGPPGLSSSIRLNLCKSCAVELRDGIDCQLAAAMAESDQLHKETEGTKEIAWIREAFETIKERHRQTRTGGCRVFSIGDACKCTLCLCDKIREYIEEQSPKA